MFQLAREIAAQLAQQFSADYPVSLQNLSGRKSVDIYQKALLNLKTQAQVAQREKRFGIVSRIVLARSFQATLAKLGYAGGVQRQSTAELASAITFASK